MTKHEMHEPLARPEIREVDNERFSAHLRALVHRHPSVPAAADACRIPTPTLEMYLYSGALPGTRNLVALADGLGVTIDNLLFGESSRG